MTRRHCLDCPGNSRKCYVPSTLKSSASPTHRLHEGHFEPVSGHATGIHAHYGTFQQTPSNALFVQTTQWSRIQFECLPQSISQITPLVQLLRPVTFMIVENTASFFPFVGLFDHASGSSEEER